MVPPGRWYCRTALAWAIAAACSGAIAQGVFVVTEPWVLPGDAKQTSEAYMRLLSSTGATLIDVRSDLAAHVTLRSPRGQAIAPLALPLPAAEVVVLEARGYRLVLGALARRLRPGDRVPMLLTIRHADGTIQAIAVDAEVRLHSPTADHRSPHRHP